VSSPKDPAHPEVARLEALIQDHSGRRVRDLRIAIQDGGLVLWGQARTYYAKQLAQHAAMAVAKLPIRANQIQVG
jgi:hypothetical protein